MLYFQYVSNYASAILFFRPDGLFKLKPMTISSHKNQQPVYLCPYQASMSSSDPFFYADYGYYVDRQ